MFCVSTYAVLLVLLSALLTIKLSLSFLHHDSLRISRSHKSFLLCQAAPNPVSSKDLAISNCKDNLVKPMLLSASFLFTNLQSRKVHASDEKIPVVAVLGAAGKTGRLIVQLLRKIGVKVRPVYREIPKTNDFVGDPNVEMPLVGDVTISESLEKALKGVNCVIFAASASSKGTAELVDFRGVKNTANVAIKLRIPRLVVISSAAITKPNSFAFKFTNIFNGIMEYKGLGEKALYETYSDEDTLSYAVIRPGGLTDGDAIGASGITINQNDTIAGDISRSDVAYIAVAAALSESIPRNVVFEAYDTSSGSALEVKFPKKSGYEREGAALGTYDTMFSGLKPGINGFQ